MASDRIGSLGTFHLGSHCRTHNTNCCLLCQLYSSREAGAAAEMAATRKSSRYTQPFPFAPFSADRCRDSGLNSSAVSFFHNLGRRISQVSLGGFTGIKRPISSSILQLPHNASTPFCFETLSLPKSPRTIQMPSHSSF